MDIVNSNVKVKEKTNPVLALSYSFGEIGSQLSWYMVNSYLMIFYTDVVGLTAGAISLIMLIARIWDAANDPMMGAIADKTKTRWGKYRPYLMFAPPALAVFNLLTFTVFPVTGVTKVVLCLLFYIGTGMLYTVVGTTYSAIVNVIAIDSQVRMNLSTARGIASSIIGIILSAFVMPMILHFSNGDVANARGYFYTTLILSIIMIPCFWMTAKNCKEKYTEQLHSMSSSTEVKQGFFTSLKTVAKNDQLVIVMLTTFVGTVCVAGRMGLLAYYVIYVVGSYTLIAPIFTALTLGQLLGNLFVPWGTKTFGKKTWMIVLYVIMIFSFVVLFAFPINNIVFLIGVSVISGICNSSATICFGMVSDSIEYGDWKLGQRQEALVCSFLSFSVKCATAFTGAISVLLLAAVGYVAGAEQTQSALNGINFIVNLLPAIIGIIGIIPLLFYKLTPHKVESIQADLLAGKRKWDVQ